MTVSVFDFKATQPFVLLVHKAASPAHRFAAVPVWCPSRNAQIQKRWGYPL
jgi:hypothetical protein